MIARRLIAGIALLLAPAPISAQGEIALVGPPVLQFSFSNPGARSMGFGGAFVALADDATAAFANPAGLVQIARPEISIEGRSWSYSTPFSERGRAENAPSGFGIDTIDGLRTGVSSDRLGGLSFVSFVYPGENWSIAFYRHQLARFESLTATDGIFHGGSSCCQRRFYDHRIRTEMALAGYGLSGAYRLSETLSLGLSLVYFDAEFDLVDEFYWIDDDTTKAFFAPNSYLPERQAAAGTIRIDEADWGLAGGFLWQLSSQWRVGASYRQGPKLGLSGRSVAGPLNPYDLPPGTEIGAAVSPITFPDVWGLGLSYRPGSGRLTLGIEWDRVEYSAILDNLGPDFDTGTIALDDGNELRLGGEYVFLGSTPLAAVRLGLWHESDHRPRSVGGDLLEQALLRPGDDTLHYALGCGLAFERFQIDLAADFSDLVDTLSLSAIYSF